MPARPCMVSGCAPSATARRVISAKAPRDQRGPAVAPKAQAVADAAPNRQNVLQGTPQLYS